jgi:hypothetical protein
MTARGTRATKQQDIEHHYFEMFRRSYAVPAGRIDYGDKPDVILNGEKKIGVEITNFYVQDGSSPSSEQVQRVRRKAVISKAQQLYEQATGKNFQLTLGFDEDHPIENAHLVVKKLVELGQRVEGRENGQISRVVFGDVPELTYAHLYARELVYGPYTDLDFPNGPPDASEGFRAYAEYWNRREAHAVRVGIYKPLSFTARWNIAQVHDFGPM